MKNIVSDEWGEGKKEQRKENVKIYKKPQH